jgi:hypothetical protein
MCLARVTLRYSESCAAPVAFDDESSRLSHFQQKATPGRPIAGES